MEDFIKAAVAVLTIAYAGPCFAQFNPVYTDPQTGLKWTSSLPGEFTNGDSCDLEISGCKAHPMPDGTDQVDVTESDAAKECIKIGGRLPTLKEAQAMLNNFDHDRESHFGPHLSSKGLAHMNAIFGDGNRIGFWTSTLHPQSTFYGFNFEFQFGEILQLPRIGKAAVRCVK